VLNLNALEQNGVRYTVLLKKPMTNSHHQIKLAEEDMDLRTYKGKVDHTYPSCHQGFRTDLVLLKERSSSTGW